MPPQASKHEIAGWRPGPRPLEPDSTASMGRPAAPSAPSSAAQMSAPVPLHRGRGDCRSQTGGLRRRSIESL